MTKTKKVEGAGSLRIIAGQWRGRKLRFPAAQGLRPTPDRIRETVFNWLMPHIEGARCLDLFAGTGALGLEALSRGAISVTFVERQKKVADALQKNLQQLQAPASQVAVYNADAELYLKQQKPEVELVFLDPPYHTGLLQSAITALQPQLKHGTLVYLEHARDEADLQIPDNWQQLKNKQGGQVVFSLYQVN